MQLITFISAATAMVATASADASGTERSAVTLTQQCNTTEPYARIINRCDYDVHLWSVLKGDGCPSNGMVTLKTGETYSENYNHGDDATGVSIKISKSNQCTEGEIVQLEYFLSNEIGYAYNYLDVSYIDCQDNDCPTKQEGYYLVAGNQTGQEAASQSNQWCPVLSCNDPVSCAKCSYINPDDPQTKTCLKTANIDFYMCGGEAPTEDYDNAPPASSAASSQAAQSSAPAASSTGGDYDTPSSTIGGYQVKAADVTPAPAANNDYGKGHGKGHTKTEVVYVTAVEYVNAKRNVHGHARGHARRHQQFRA